MDVCSEGVCVHGGVCSCTHVVANTHSSVMIGQVKYATQDKCSVM